MQTLQYCIQARTKLAELKSKPVPTRAKIMLVESLLQKLKSVHQFQTTNNTAYKKIELNSTFFTETQSLIMKEEEQTLINQILKKQKLKIQLDQEIQTTDDDLNQISKIVETKQVYDRQLSAKIAKKSKEIELESIQEKQEKEKQREKQNEKGNEKMSKLNKVKSTPSLLFQKIFG